MDIANYGIPPNVIDSEQSVLAGCMLFLEIGDEVCDTLAPKDFYRTTHQIIYQAILDLKTAHQPFDLLAVMDKLKTSGRLNQCGGAAYLAELTDTPIPIDTAFTVNKIRECSVLRGVIGLCNDTMRSCYDRSKDATKMIDHFQQKILQLNISAGSQTYSSLQQLVMEGDDRHEALYMNKSNITGVPAGFKDIDDITCGFQPGDLIILAARPSMGKSALARNMAVNMAKRKFTNVIISLEMAKEQIYDLILASASGVNSLKFRNGLFSKEDWKMKAEATEGLYGLRSFVADKDCFRIADICRIVRQLKQKEGLRAVFIDYLQLTEGDTKKTKNYEIGEITRTLKQLAKEVAVPIILLSQLNRKCEERTDKRPMMSDLRDSGATEQDADIILFLYRHEQYVNQKYNEDGTMTKIFADCRGTAELNIAKQRMGPTKRISLTWLAKTAQFRDA